MSDTLFAEIRVFLAERRSDDPYRYHTGGCPICLAPGTLFYYDERLNEWFVCLGDGVRWWHGSGNFSTWQDLTPETLAWQQRELSGLREVKPYYPPSVDALLAQQSREGPAAGPDDLEIL